MTVATAPVRLTGGVVAFNERGRIGSALRSLLSQSLPPGHVWESIIVVVSGSTDGTAEEVAALSAAEPRIRLIVQAEREGKSDALGELFRRVRGDYLVLLNGDAVAHSGAVVALLGEAGLPDQPFAVMANPEPGRTANDRTGRAVRLLWAIHNEFHARSVGRPGGNHLSDELLLLPGRALPPLPSGVVNDGSFIGAWLSLHDGTLRVAASARVSIATPRSFGDHVRQRRRILFGHRQVERLLAVPPSTVERFSRRHFRKAVALVAQQSRNEGGAGALASLLVAELLAGTLAEIDGVGVGVDHARWRPVASHEAAGSLSEPTDGG